MWSDLCDSGCGSGEQSGAKRKRTGRRADVMKRLRATSHETGEDCKCTHLKCFETISPEERQRIIGQFNELGSYDAQSRHLTGLIQLAAIARRRNVKSAEEANFRLFSYRYRVRARVSGEMQDVSVCHKAFVSLHGITNRRVQTLKKNLTELGEAKDDGRGKHGNRRHALSEETKTKVVCFIKSLNHSLKDSSTIYLPEELDVSKLHRMYNDSNGENKVGYTTFRKMCEENFNISFGLPKEDTSGACDMSEGEIATTEEEVSTCEGEEATKALQSTEIKKEISFAED